jgi:hypothetical protein
MVTESDRNLQNGYNFDAQNGQFRPIEESNTMKKVLGVFILTTAISLPFNLVADSHEKEMYFYATYFYCKTATHEQADELVKKNNAPVYDAAVEDGTIKGWGWLSHHTGGKWRRIQYHMSDSVEGLLSAQETLAKRVDEKLGGADDGFANICGAHDDYIWKMEAGSGPSATRGKAALSVYEVCDLAREERADEIVKNDFAPIYNKAVEDGKITSWGWNSHQVGGKYRRLATMTASSFPELLKARGEILEAIYGEGENPVADEYTSICTSHSDYLWEIVHEKS